MNPMTLVLGGIYILSLLVFFLIAIGLWLRSRKLTSTFTRYGMLAGVGLIVTEILAFFTIPGGVQSALPFIFLIDCIAFFRLLAFTAAGMYCCAKLGIAPFRMFARHMWTFETADHSTDTDAPNSNFAPIPDDSAPANNTVFNEVEELAPPSERSTEITVEPTADPPVFSGDVAVDPAENDDIPEEEVPSIVTSPSELLVEQPLPPTSLWHYWLATLSVVALACLYSAVLFLITKPAMSNQAQELFGSLEAGEASILYTVILGVAFAYAEEIAFRLGIQNIVAYGIDKSRQRYWLAILLTTVLWTIGHTGTLDPEWVKLSQIFPIGLMLGWLFRRHGIESAFIAHALFNVIMSLFGESLIVT